MGEVCAPNPSHLNLLVTGFGPFPAVAKNPTQAIIEDLFNSAEWTTPGAKMRWLRVAVESRSSYMRARCCTNHLTAHVDVLQPSVLSVSACSVTKWMQQVYSQHAHVPLVTVHLGVDAKATCFKLERTAYNNATFRVPDIDGYQPQHVRICTSMALDEPLSTDLPLDKIVGMCSSKGGLVSHVLPYVYTLSFYTPRRQAQT